MLRRGRAGFIIWVFLAGFLVLSTGLLGAYMIPTFLSEIIIYYLPVYLHTFIPAHTRTEAQWTWT